MGSVSIKPIRFCIKEGQQCSKSTNRSLLTSKHINFLSDIKAIVELEEIPQALLFNWDHTGINYVPSCFQFDFEKEGIKRDEIARINEKHQIMEFLPPQIFYKGKTKACFPSTVSSLNLGM